MVFPNAAIAWKSPAEQSTREEWRQRNASLLSATTGKILSSRQERQDAWQLRDRVHNGLHDSLKDSEAALRVRASDVERSAISLRSTLHRTLEQASATSDVKQRVENAREDMTQAHLAALTRCLSTRDKRMAGDLVKDALHESLTEEFDHLQRTSKSLHASAHALWSQECRLRQICARLSCDVDDKQKALTDDLRQLDLHSGHGSVSLKPNSNASLRGIVTERHWWGNSAELTSSAEEATADAERLVCDSLALVRVSRSEADRNQERSRALMRAAIREQERTLGVLQVQRNKLEAELPELSQSLLELERSLVTSAVPLKVAQSRLENRKWRPLQEVCHDLPQRTLINEAQQIQLYQGDLKQRIQQARAAYQSLSQQLNQVNKDLELKNKTLQLECECFDIHTRPLLERHNLPELKWTELGLPINELSFKEEETRSTSGVSDLDTSWEDKRQQENLDLDPD